MNRTHLGLGDTGRPENRVIRIVNLHYEAGSGDVRDLFGDDFTVIDFMRGVNPKTNKNTVGYVLLAIEQERINAQALSGSNILDREVKVIPAQGGFRISASGDRLLPPSEGEHAGAFSAGGETREEAPLAVDDVDAFPSLGMTATPLVATIPARVSARKQPAQQRALQNRLLFLNNVGQGPEVNETSFRLYFGKYTLVDVKRPLDPRTGMPHPTAFVMFASVEIRDAVLHNLKNVPMQGRKVTLEVPRTFQNVDEQGFVPTANESVAIVSTFPRNSVANAVPLAPPFVNLDTRGRLPVAPSSESVLPGDDNSNSSNFYHLLGQLQMTKGDEQQNAQRVKFDRAANKERQTKNAKVVWGISRAHIGQRHQSQQQMLKPMPSGVEGPGQIVQGPSMTPHRFLSPLARHFLMAPRGPPSGINTDFNPSSYNWGLNGNRDPVSHVIREDEWHGGPGAIEQRLRKSETQFAKPTVAQRVIAIAGIIQHGKYKEEFLD